MLKNNMKFKFFFISYSVICAKYTYCFEASKDMPIRYFDGKEWKSITPRNSHVKTRAPTAATDPFVIRLAEFFKEIKGIRPEATTQNIPTRDTTTQKTTTKTTPTEEITIQTTPTEEITLQTTATEEISIPSIPTEEITIQTTPTEEITTETTTTTKPTPLKKITTKEATIIAKPILKTRTKTTTKKTKIKRVASLKMTTKKLRRQFTQTIKSTAKDHYFYCCKSRLKRTTTKKIKLRTKKIGPRLLKTMTKKVYNRPVDPNWRPTYPKLPSPKPTNKYATRTCKKYCIKKAQKSTRKTTTETTSIEEFTTTPTTEEITPETTTTETATMKKLSENNRILEEAGALPGDMSNLMREFLKFVEEKKARKPGLRAVESIVTEPTKTEPTKTEPPKTETPKTEPIKTESPKTEPTKTEPPKTEPTKTEPTTTEATTMPLAVLLVTDNESAMSDTEDLMRILMGVKRNNKLNKGNITVSRKAQNKEKDLQDETTRHIKEDNATLELNKQRKFIKYLQAKLYQRRSNKTYHISGTETYSDELEGKDFSAKLDETKNNETLPVYGKNADLDKLVNNNAKYLDDSEVESFLNLFKNKYAVKKKEFSKDHEAQLDQDALNVFRASEKELNLDKLVDNNARILNDGEIESFLNMFKNKHAIKNKEFSEHNEAKLYLDALNARYSENSGRNEERNALNAIKDAYSRSVKDNLQNVPKAIFHSHELHNILAYITPKHARFTEIKSQSNDEDDLHDLEERTTSLNLKVVKGNNGNAKRKEEDQIPRSYEYTTMINFKYALDDL